MGIWVGRYAMVGGEVQEHGPWLVERRRVRDDESVRLVVMSEPVDERSAEFCHEVADAVATLFRRESLSLTGGLLRALRQAHNNLAEWNRRSLREHRVAVGITCVAIREGEATVAQVGPSAVYVRHGDSMRRLTTEGEAAAQPLGGAEPIEPAFHGVRLADSELLLLTTNVERELGLESIAQALGAGPERALAELFMRTRAINDMTAAFVAELDIEEEEAAAEEAALGLLEAAPEAQVIGMPPEPPRPAEVDTGRDSPAPSEPASSMPSVRRPRSAGSAPFAPALPWRVIGAVVAVALAVAALAWFLLPPLLSEDRGERLGQSVASAETHLAAALQAQDLVEARRELGLAQSAISEARSLAPEDPRVAELDVRAQAVAAAQDRVVEIEPPRTVIRFEGTLTAPLQPAALVAGGDLLWLLDGDRGRVFALDPAGEQAPFEAFRAGQSYGGVTARDPIALAWDQQAGRLLMLDAERRLFAVAPGVSPQPLVLRGIEELRSVSALAAYAGNLYVLDPQGGEVWRYLPAGEGFDSERSGLLGRAEINAASGLAVDGDVFLLSGNGVRHFRLGDELGPLLRGVDRPPESPTGLVQDVLRGRFYVADRGGRRVLLSDRDGAFLAQYRHPSFFDLRGLALASDGTALYALTGEGVYEFDPLSAQ